MSDPRDNLAIKPKVVAVIILYYPNPRHIQRFIAELDQQLSQIVLVDNTPQAEALGIDELLEGKASNVHYLPQGENQGLGVAQNIGVAKARKIGCSHVLFCDQDSLSEPTMVAHLLQAEKDALSVGIKVGAVGPRYYGPVKSTLSDFVTFDFMRFSRVPCNPDSSFVLCAFVIASGCLIRLSCLDDVGGMDEAFFIDHVDTDWCLRAHAKGYQIIGACNAVMQHDLGELRVDINLLGRKRQISIHKPYRQYYVLRNSILLYQRSYTSWRWFGGDLIRLIQRFVFFSVFEGPRWQNFKMMVMGIRDGLFGRSGKLS